MQKLQQMALQNSHIFKQATCWLKIREFCAIIVVCISGAYKTAPFLSFQNALKMPFSAYKNLFFSYQKYPVWSMQTYCLQYGNTILTYCKPYFSIKTSRNCFLVTLFYELRNVKFWIVFLTRPLSSNSCILT